MRGASRVIPRAVHVHGFKVDLVAPLAQERLSERQLDPECSGHHPLHGHIAIRIEQVRRQHCVRDHTIERDACAGERPAGRLGVVTRDRDIGIGERGQEPGREPIHGQLRRCAQVPMADRNVHRCGIGGGDR